MNARIVFAAKVLGLSLAAALAVVVASGVGGLFLYILLDPLIRTDDLAAFMVCWLPFIGLGLPALVVASRLALLGRRPKTQLALAATTVVFGSLGFAGFWVGAMGI